MTTLPNRRQLFATALAGAAVSSLAACSPGDSDTATSAAPAAAVPATPMPVADWMSWEGGVDLAAVTDATLTQPNIILHVARMVHTPEGSAPSGMVFYQPDPKQPPVVMGFVSSDAKVGAYFGPKIFAGTPFEKAPVLTAEIKIDHAGSTAGSVIKAGGHVFEVHFEDLEALKAYDRAPGGATPFTQRTLEAAAGKVTLKVDGQPVTIIVPPVGLSGGAAAVWAPAGTYAR